MQRIDHLLCAPILLPSQDLEVIRILQKNDVVTRSLVSRITGWSRAKASQIISDLITQGFICESSEEPTSAGRPSGLIQINKSLGFVVGVDIGATSLDLAIAGLDAQILARHSELADVMIKPEKYLEHAIELIIEMLRDKEISPNQVLGIGIGVPGPVDFPKGILVSPPLMPAWDNYPIRNPFKMAFPCAVVMIDNDVNIMAFGELRAGLNRNIDNFIYIKIGTGIGAGIVSDGYLHRGSDGCAGDIGHICADINGPLCRCGKVGCLEAIAAGPAIANQALEAVKAGQGPKLLARMQSLNGQLRSEDVGIAAKEGDTVAIEIINQSGHLIGNVIAGLVNFFNPRMIIIGGGVSKIGNQLLASIRQTVLSRSTALATYNLIINHSNLGDDAGVIGGIYMAREYIFKENQR